MKKYIKSSQLKYPFMMLGEYADGYSTECGGDDEEDCMYRLIQLQDKHGDLTWYSGLTNEDYTDGEYIGRENYIYESTDVDTVLSGDPETYSNPITYQEIYSIVFKNAKGNLNGYLDTDKTDYDNVLKIAQLAYRRNYGGYCGDSPDEAAAAALELYESMTGRWYDPTREEYDDLVDSIF